MLIIIFYNEYEQIYALDKSLITKMKYTFEIFQLNIPKTSSLINL